MPIIYHLITRSAWDEAKSAAEYRADSLDTEGFIHCSQDVEQMLRVANRFYTGRDDILVLEVDTARLTSRVRREPSRSGEIYPHIYGPLNTDAVVGFFSLTVDAGGSFSSVLSTGEH